jgi:hypothetical protein
MFIIVRDITYQQPTFCGLLAYCLLKLGGNNRMRIEGFSRFDGAAVKVQSHNNFSSQAQSSFFIT